LIKRERGTDKSSRWKNPYPYLLFCKNPFPFNPAFKSTTKNALLFPLKGKIDKKKRWQGSLNECKYDYKS
jgi:hypothetical protein